VGLGRVRSPKSIQIAYQGQPLAARDRCYWKVRVWDAAGRASPWSEPALWSMGLLHAADWQAEWLRVEELDPNAPPPPPPPKITILKATYGSHDDQRITDVTEIVRQKVIAKGGVLAVQASNELFGDPAVGGGKQLVVEYEMNGKRETVRAPEYQFVTAKPDPQAEPPRAKRIQTPRMLRRGFAVARSRSAPRCTRRRWASTRCASTASAWATRCSRRSGPRTTSACRCRPTT
jgi:hypothetical protein